MSDNVTNDENAKKTVGFKVSPSEYNVLQQYAQIFHNQVVEDPDTKQPQRQLERPEIGFAHYKCNCINIKLKNIGSSNLSCYS